MTAPRLLFTASLALIGSCLIAQSPPASTSPKEILDHIQSIRAEAGARQKNGEQVSQVAVDAEIDKYVQSVIAGVDPSKVSADDTYKWMQVFQYAKQNDAINTLAERAYSQRMFELMEIDTTLVRSLVEQEKLAEARSHIRNTAFGFGPAMIGQFALGIQRALIAQAPKHLTEVTAIYDALLDRIHVDAPLTKADTQWGPVAYADLASKKYAVIYNSGKKAEALKGLAALKKEMDKYPNSKDAYATSASTYVTKVVAQLTSPETQFALNGKAAPLLVSDRHLGEYPGQDGLKGKVVVLDFMAHWCGPCKAALPELVKLQNALGAKGLQVISLTGYYGYFGARQAINKDQEFEAMKGFVKDYQMSWPVLFDATSKNNSNYGVTGIPQLVVIDRKGIVRKIDIGYTPESFAATAKLIEGLLATPAN